MEETTKRIIEVEVDLGKASSRLAEVNREMDDLKNSTKELKKENADLYKELRSGEKQWSDVSQTISENSKKIAENEAKTKQLKAEQSALSGQIAETAKKNRVYGDSYKELSAQLADMKNAYRSLTEAQRESAEGKELLKQIQEIDDAMKKADATMGNFQRNVGNYPGAMSQANEQLRIMNDQLAKLKIEGKEDTAEFAALSQQVESLKATIENAANEAVKPVTAQIKEMTQQLINMRMEGKANTEEYQALLQKVGEMKDMMLDAQQEVKQMASDTAALNSVLDAGKLAAGAFSAALGVMNLVGGQDSETAKELAEAQKKLQAAIAITTGIQAVQNALQKQSALMMGIHKIQMLAAAKAQDAYTAATGRATIAQRLFNTVAKSNPYVLLAGLILTVVGAISAFTLGSKEQQEQLEKTNFELKKQLDYLNELNEMYKKLEDEAVTEAEQRLETLKAQGAESDKIIEAENKVLEAKKASIDAEKERLGYTEQNYNLLKGKYAVALDEYNDKVERMNEALRAGHTELAAVMQDQLALEKEQLDGLAQQVGMFEELRGRIFSYQQEYRKTQAERRKEDKKTDDAAKAAEEKRKKALEERKKYEALTLTEMQKAEDALNALIADEYEKRRTIEETAYKRNVEAINKSMAEEKKKHGENTQLYKSYLSQLESLRIDHERKMSDIAEDQINNEKALRDTAIKQMEADNELYWENRINEALVKGQEAGQIELEQLKDRLDNMYQYTDESDAEFYARRLEAQKAYNEKKKALNDAEVAMEKAKAEYMADIAGSLSSLMETVAGENKQMVKASKIVALAEVAIKQGVAIAEAVAASAAGDPYTYALRVAAAIASTVAAMASAIESINSVKLARGTGYVTYPGKKKSDGDVVPAMLTVGEGVANEKANAMFPGAVDAMNEASFGNWAPMLNMLANSNGAPAHVTATANTITEMQMGAAFRAAIADLDMVVSVEEIDRVRGQVKVVENLATI